MQRLLKYEYWFLLPLLLSAILSWRSVLQKWPRPYRIFAVLLMISFATEVLAISWKWYLYDDFTKPYSKNNFWIYNPFITIRFAMLAIIFYQILESVKVKKVIRMVSPVLVLFCIGNYIFIQGPFQYNTYSMLLTHLSIIGLCVYYFRQLLNDSNDITLHKEPAVWMALGTFIYMVSSFPFLFILGFLNMGQTKLAYAFLPINKTLNLIMCACYLISFICKPQSARHP